MKRYLFALSLASLVAGGLGAQADPKFRPNLVPNVDAKKAIDAKNTGVSPVLKAQVIGERYRLIMSFNPTHIVDLDGTPADYSYDCYGTLKINGTTWWEMPRETSDRGAQQLGTIFTANNLPKNAVDTGFSLTKSNAFNQGRKFEFDVPNDNPSLGKLKISLRLYDMDGWVGSKDLSKDDTFGRFDETLDLSKGAGDYYWFWKDGNGNDSDFYVRIEHVRSLYGTPDDSSKLPQIDTKPMIRKPKFAEKSPGPIVKTAPMRN